MRLDRLGSPKSAGAVVGLNGVGLGGIWSSTGRVGSGDITVMWEGCLWVSSALCGVQGGSTDSWGVGVGGQ